MKKTLKKPEKNMTINEIEEPVTEASGSVDKPEDSAKPVEIDFDGADIRDLIEEIAEAVQAGRTIDLPLFMKDLKSAIAKGINDRRVNQTKAAERLRLNRGSYRKYLCRALYAKQERANA